MLLSICVLTYNRRGYLEKLIQSIKDSKVLETGQVELVIIDNGSTDNTRQFLSSLPEDISIRIVHREFNLRVLSLIKNLLVSRQDSGLYPRVMTTCLTQKH